MIYLLRLSLIVTVLCQYRRADKLLLNLSARECVCPGDIVTYECRTVGVGAEVVTVWKGDFFHCSSGKRVIELVHRQRDDFGSHKCNDGNVVARIIRGENDSFISQLNITLTHDVAGKNIERISDNGTNTERVGSMNLKSAILPLPPENISWIVTSHQQLDVIIFMWSAHSPRLDCQAIYYKIIASRDCGSCPTTTNHTNATCTDIPIDGSMCIFAVETVVCGMSGELSCPVSVDLDTVIGKKSRHSSGISPALVAAIIILGVALSISLVGFATVTILLIKFKTKVQTIAATAATLIGLNYIRKGYDNWE